MAARLTVGANVLRLKFVFSHDLAEGAIKSSLPWSRPQVIVGGEYRYYGRGAKGNRVLGEAEIAELYRRREERNQDGGAILAEVVACAGIPANPGHGILRAFARPVASDPDLFERALPALGGQRGIHQSLLTAVWETELRDSYGPNVERTPFWERGSADEWRLATRSTEERLDNLTALVEVRINRDGRGQHLCGRASDARLSGDSGEFDHRGGDRWRDTAPFRQPTGPTLTVDKAHSPPRSTKNGAKVFVLGCDLRPDRQRFSVAAPATPDLC